MLSDGSWQRKKDLHKKVGEWAFVFKESSERCGRPKKQQQMENRSNLFASRRENSQKGNYDSGKKSLKPR